MYANGFGYDCGAALRASFVLAFMHFAEKISACLPAGRLAKASPGLYPIHASSLF